MTEEQLKKANSISDEISFLKETINKTDNSSLSIYYKGFLIQDESDFSVQDESDFLEKVLTDACNIIKTKIKNRISLLEEEFKNFTNNKMKPVEAFCFTLEKVEELRDSGIEVEVTPVKYQSNDTDENGVVPILWKHIAFCELDKAQFKDVLDAANYLGLAGIRFDVGGIGDALHWELDWSFRYIQGSLQEEWRDAVKELGACFEE